MWQNNDQMPTVMATGVRTMPNTPATKPRIVIPASAVATEFDKFKGTIFHRIFSPIKIAYLLAANLVMAVILGAAVVIMGGNFPH